MRQAANTVVWDELVSYLTRRLGDAQLAADLAQEAYARRAGLGPEVAVINERAWLFTVARRLVIDHWRARGAEPRHVPADDALKHHAAPEADAETRLLSREAIETLSRAIDELPPRTREVFRLQKFEQLSYAEIADRLGMARNTVMVHMGKALGHCRAAMRAHRAAE